MIIDLALPDMRGLELIAVVRDVYGPSIPVILTGRGLRLEDIKTAVSLGVRDCVNKPSAAPRSSNAWRACSRSRARQRRRASPSR